MSLPLDAENATQAWDDLAARLDRFLALWEAGEEPLLADYLPEAPHVHRRMVLIELVKVDLEQRTSRGSPRPLESYTADFPELLEEGEPPCELIYEEYHIRRGAGMTVTPQHYFDRFPKSAPALKRLMGTEGFSQTTQLSAAKRVVGLAAGQKIDDFDLKVELGKGAFGSVFLAQQISMGRLVALKVSADKGHEPQTLGQFDHPNIVRVFDQRRLPERGLLLCYMTYAPGGTLQDVVRKVRGTPASARNGKLVIESVDDSMQRAGQFTGEETPSRKRMAAAPWPEMVCKIGVQLAQALDYAHRKGVLHRDVKPANVLLSAEGSPKLADFNISFNSAIEGASPAAYFGGSLAYMSPEQLEACNPSHDRKPEDLDGRSDIFSLAVVLWELLHGERPFADDELSGAWSMMLHEMAGRRRGSTPKAAAPTNDPVATRLEQVLRTAMSPDPAQRYPDGAAMARELLLCLSPRAWDLTHNMTTGWRDLARREPMLPLAVVVLPPFILAGWFNLWYNQTYFLPALHKLDEKMEQAFWVMVPPVNLVLYPAGVALVWWYVAPMISSLRRLARGEKESAEALRRARSRAINVGHGVAWIGVALWVVAGIAFPTGICLQAGYYWQPFAHFILAMFVSGLISCGLPFLSTTWLSVRVFIPTLLGTSVPEPSEQKQLTKLSWYSGIYFMVSLIAPLFAMLLIILTGGEDTWLVLVALIATSIVCLSLAYAMWQRIREDLAALTIATRSVDLSSSHTDTTEAF